MFSSLQHLTRDESPSPTAEEFHFVEDDESQLDEWVELQVSGETSPPLEGDDQDLETPTILWVGPAFGTAASDELQEQLPSTSPSSGRAAQESNSDTEVLESDTEDVLRSPSVHSSQQTPAASLEESQLVARVKTPVEEEEMFGLKLLEKEAPGNRLKLPVDIATPVIYYGLVNEGTPVAQALEPEPESARATKQSPTLVEEAKANPSLDLLQHREKIPKGEDFSQQLFHSSTVSESSTAAHEETEKGNSEPDPDACSSFQVRYPPEEPTSGQGTWRNAHAEDRCV